MNIFLVFIFDFLCTIRYIICVFANNNNNNYKYHDCVWFMQKTYSTEYSQAVTHPSTNSALCCLTSVIGRELVFSTWYGRRHILWSNFAFPSSVVFHICVLFIYTRPELCGSQKPWKKNKINNNDGAQLCSNYIANASKFTINDDILTLLSYTDKNDTEQHNPNSLFERFLYQ